MNMPTTSQIQVLDKLNIPHKVVKKLGEKKRHCKRSTSLSLPKINFDSEGSDMKYPRDSVLSKNLSLPVLPPISVQDDIGSDDDDVEEKTVHKLHGLGFWDVKEKKRKVGISVKKEVDYTEFNNQYTQELVDGIMEKVQNATKKTQPPQELPTALCFTLKGSIASHKDVKDKIDSLLYLCKGCKVESIQYLPLKTRWLIIMDKKQARNYLAGTEIDFWGHKVMLRRYDDIAALEYRTFERANGLLQIVNNPF